MSIENGHSVPNLPIDGHQHSHYHSSQECNSNASEKKVADFGMIKLVIGMMIAVIRKHWFMSLGTLSSLFSIWIFYGFIASFFLSICSTLALFYQISDQLVFWPNFPPDSRESVRLPSTVGLPSENLFIYAKDGTKLHAVFIKQDSQTMKSVPSFVYLHGNAGNIGHRILNVYDMYRILGVNILLVEYRGYGLSRGSPSERGLYLDAQTALSYLRTRNDIDLNKIVIFGRSLGGAVAIDCASLTEMRSRIAALVIENTFTSIPGMAQSLFSGVKILPSLPTWCHKNKFNSKFKMCRVVVPTLLMSGQSDTLVPPRMMVELYHSCASPLKRLFQFTNGSHNETWRCRGYYQALGSFLDEVFHRRARIKPLPPGVVCISDSQVL